MARMAGQNFRESSVWVRPSDQAWFDMADSTPNLKSNSGMNIFELPDIHFNSF